MAINKLLTILILAVLTATPAYSIDDCGLASEIAKKAYDTFQEDQSKGLKLFIKARDLCPGKREYTYNLGIAYYRFGRLLEAEQFLKEALNAEDGKPSWHNNLAEVLLERGKVEEALAQAEKAYQVKASARNADTLSRIRLANDNHQAALTLIHRSVKKWPEEKELEKTHNLVLDKYLNYFLAKLEAGDTDTALSALKKVNYDTRGLRAYCLALAAAGKLDKAIKTADDNLDAHPELASIFDKLLGKKIESFFRIFKNGKSAQALKEARVFAKKYPGSKRAREAYQQLYNAFLASTSTIEVPEPVSNPEDNKAIQSSPNQLLSKLVSDLKNESAGLNLTVDIEEKIPRGKMKRPSGVAVVIGNQNYAKQNRGIADVKFAKRDAVLMKKYLVTTMGFAPENIIYLIDASSGDFRNIFGSKDNPGMLQNYLDPSGKSEIFIYYVGHGAPGPGGHTSYLVPVDARISYIGNTGYDLDFFYNILQELPAKEITVVLDACFSGSSATGPLFKEISPAMLKTAEPIKELTNGIIFAGAGQNQVCTWYPAKKHSLFTYFFLKGIGGAADTNRNKTITALELGRYLKKKVPYWARRQANRQQVPDIRGQMDIVLTKLE